jgi:hypothetical protein
MATTTQRAWAAGIYEGEGTCGAYKERDTNHYSARIAINMNDEDVLLKFCEIVGVGKVYGPYKRKATNGYFWTYQVTGWSAMRHIYRMFKPWLFPRRIEQFERALQHERKEDDWYEVPGHWRGETWIEPHMRRHRV